MIKLLLLTLLVSCSNVPIKRTSRITTTNDRIENCVNRFVEKSGVNPEVAVKTCTKIFRQQQIIERIEAKR